MKQYIWNILIAIDQLGNTLIGGDPDETISSNAAKNQHILVFRWLAWFLELIDSGHMQRAIESDEGKNAAIKLSGHGGQNGD